MIARILSSILIFIIKLYQGLISPILGANCRFSPTCSQYGIEAIRKHGLLKGVRLTVTRILSCHPWGRHGHDPVP